MNATISAFVICVEVIIYYIIYMTVSLSLQDYNLQFTENKIFYMYHQAPWPYFLSTTIL